MTALEVGSIGGAAVVGAIIGSKVLMLGAVFAALILYVQARIQADHIADIATKTLSKASLNAREASEGARELGEHQELTAHLFKQMQEVISKLNSQITELKQHQLQLT